MYLRVSANPFGRSRKSTEIAGGGAGGILLVSGFGARKTASSAVRAAPADGRSSGSKEHSFWMHDSRAAGSSDPLELRRTGKIARRWVTSAGLENGGEPRN